MEESPQSCGFADVRFHPKGGYYCIVCKKRMDPDYEAKLKESLTPWQFVDFLRQCDRSGRS